MPPEHGRLAARTVDRRDQVVRGARLPRHPDGRRGRRGRFEQATVYHYYASKSLILFDIYRRAAVRTLAAVHDDPTWTAREALYQYTVRLLTQIAENPRAPPSASRNSPTSPNGSPRNRWPKSGRRKPRSTNTCTG